jgi:phosphate transport system permease protein
MMLLKSNISFPSLSEKITFFITLLATIFSVFVLLFIISFLISKSVPVFEEIGVMNLFTDDSWNPTEGEFQIAPMIVSSLFIMIGATFLSFPFGLGISFFCNYFSIKPIRRMVLTMMQLLGGIPSVVFGFWGIMQLNPIINSFHPPGASLLAGIIIVAFMILPTFVLLIDASMKKIPRDVLLSAKAMSLSRKSIGLYVVFPHIKWSVLSSFILASGRAIGETMAVVMVTGNIVQVPDSLFRPVRALTSNIALEMSYAMGAHRSSLFLTGVILTFVVVVLIFTSSLIKNLVNTFQRKNETSCF